MKNDIILSLRDVECRFGKDGGEVVALGGVSLDVYRGEIFGLVGESGSGKTTAGRIVTGIYRPTRGEVMFDGEMIALGKEGFKEELSRINEWGRVKKTEIIKGVLKHPMEIKNATASSLNVNKELQKQKKSPTAGLREADRLFLRRDWGKRGIQMIFQDPSGALNPCMTALEAVMEGLVARGGMTRCEMETAAIATLKKVGLRENVAHRYPHELSGGQKQRLGIARAIIVNPKLLIADEPVSALDVSVGAQVVNLLSELASEMSLTVLFIAHDLSVVRHICDRVGVMFRGRLVEVAPTEKIFEDPKHPYTRALLSAIPKPDPGSSAIRIPVPAPISGRGVMREVSPGHTVLFQNEEESPGGGVEAI